MVKISMPQVILIIVVFGAWLLGIVYAKGTAETSLSYLFPPFAYYKVVEHIAKKYDF